jgi:superfamily II DNA/RNA helicase
VSSAAPSRPTSRQAPSHSSSSHQSSSQSSSNQSSGHQQSRPTGRSRSGRPARAEGGFGPSGRPPRGTNRTRSNSDRPAPRAAAASYVWNEIPLEEVDPASLPSFSELGLHRGLTEALARAGVTQPFPIQAAVIPDVLAGRDVLGRAATGSGKTLAFGLPMLGRLEASAQGARSAPRRPRGLVLVPTRELAMQVTEALAPLGQARGLTVRLVAGGLPIGKQITSLERGVDVLVCTPGRLIDLLDRGACFLDSVEVSVVDEADHMADLGFLPVVRQLLALTPSDGQRLLFSATLDGAVGTLVTQFLKNPAAHAVASATARVDTMDHHVFRVHHEDKVEVAAHIGARTGRTIMFVRTKHGADRLAKQLGRVGVAAGALHGGRSQSQRTRALDAFKDGSVPVLVATDVAARGIHVDDISLVLHVDPPADAKDYLHRSGRTARAGATGTVVMLTTPDQERPVRKMLGEANVDAAHRAMSTSDEDLAQVTGGRRPSGVPVRESAHSETPRRRPAGDGATRRQGAPRRSAGTDSSARPAPAARRAAVARHPQHAERRPRRATRPAGSPTTR